MSTGAVTGTVRPQDVVEHALAQATGDGCIVIARESSEANLRWAGNTLTTNGVMRGRQLTVIATVGSGEGVASGVVSRSNVGLEQVEALVQAAEDAARSSRPAEDAAALIEPGTPDPEWDAPPSETSVEVFTDFAADLGDSFLAARAEGRELFGFAEHQLATTYLATSTGLRRRTDQPTGRVEITGKSSDWSRSTWVGQGTRDFSDVAMPQLDAELRRRLGWAERQIDLPAGRYETLLPPSSVADLLIYQYWSSIARDANDGRSVFSRPGGGTRVGERLSERPVRLWSDPSAAGLECTPFVVANSSGAAESVFDNGLPISSTDWITGGELAALIQTRHSAALTGLAVTPFVDNLMFSAADATRGLEEMVADTARGLLLTSLWYIREVDPETLLLTGLTRDGVYLVEDGEVVGEVNNFRFNESPVDILGRLSEVGLTERTLCREWNDYFTRTATPAWRVPDFNMSSVSRAR
jgi:predicted Zn-dependent protease